MAKDEERNEHQRQYQRASRNLLFVMAGCGSFWPFSRWLSEPSRAWQIMNEHPRTPPLQTLSFYPSLASRLSATTTVTIPLCLPGSLRPPSLDSPSRPTMSTGGQRGCDLTNGPVLASCRFDRPRPPLHRGC